MGLRQIRLVGVFLWLTVSPLAAQSRSDTAATTTDTTVVAGAGYGLNGPLAWLQKWIFGSRHRKLWAAPIVAERFDLATIAGGLQPIAADSGPRSGYLYLRGADGSLYTFHQIAPDLSRLLPANLKTDFGAGLTQDLQSGRHPGASFVVPPLADAVGLGPLPTPRLGLLPEDSALNQFSSTKFAGSLGFLSPGIITAYRSKVGVKDSAISATELLEKLSSAEPPRVDRSAYLRERMFDVYLGSWDPVPQEWLWDRNASGAWGPRPRPRDMAFVRLDGLVAGLAGQQVPNFATFSKEYDTRLAVTTRERTLDRWILPPLGLDAYIATANSLASQLTDSVIEGAVRQLPPSYYEAGGEKLIGELKARRDHLPDAAERYYRIVMSQADLYGSRGDDTVIAVRREDGRLDVSETGRFQASFDPKQTDEVRLYLLEGNDQVVVRGEGNKGPKLVIGGGPGDVLVDSTEAGRVVVHNSEDVSIQTSGKVKREKDPLELPTFTDTTRLDPPPIKRQKISFAPWLDLNSDLGLFIGGGPVFTNYDYGYDPYKSRIRVRAAYATAVNDWDFDFRGEFRRRGKSSYFLIDAEASAVEVLKFFGYGNETTRIDDTEFYDSGQWLFSLAPSFVVPVTPRSNFKIGPAVKYVATDLTGNRFIAQTQPYGTQGFGQVGAQTSVGYDTRDSWRFATRGVLLTGGASFYPALWDADEAFGDFNGSAATYFTPVPSLTIGVRGSGKYVWGKYPVHEAAYIGGSRTVRGFAKQRYAGDAS
ncbi:MAG TPA: BamA/TamA family outer membrane protein, partial [Gemmatimonadales bacterium]|nr:BamA/TamA family outer membrane protein [Gemmatimonadales bacterium]